MWAKMFVPTTKEEMKANNIKQFDIILISGDVYIDSPYDGIAVVAKHLIKNGFKVAIIAQPNLENDSDILRLGEPKLFWGVSAGAVDSMVANYTATKKRKKSDDLTPGAINNRRPDRAIIKYTNAIQRFSQNKTIIIGGIEASLRRIAHYDFWDNKVRRSILFDSKATCLVYGMGEKQVLEIANRINESNFDFSDIRGICYISNSINESNVELDSFEDVSKDKIKFIKAFNEFYKNNDPINAHGLYQKHADRYLIHNPPAFHESTEELDSYYELDFEYDAHPFYKRQGIIKGLDTTKNSVTTHRGCFGECNFCAIAVHQGRRIRSRSEKSIIDEVVRLSKQKNFNGIINDVGAATANMYGFECKKQSSKGSCKDKRCAFPSSCPAMNINHSKQLNLLNQIKKIKAIRKIYIRSGLRYDLIMQDKVAGEKYLKNLTENHVGGQLKIAPEHNENKVLNVMGKPAANYLKAFKNLFDKYSKEAGKNQFLTYYFIAAHPGCELNDMKNLKKYVNKDLKLNPEQIQIFTPTPMTYSSVIYYTELDPITLKPIFVEKDTNRKEIQKKAMI